MPDTFPGIAFQSGLATEAILLGIFGFLYTVYAMYLSMPTVPPVVEKLRWFCRIVATLIVIIAALTIASLGLISLTATYDVVLAVGFGVTVAAVAATANWWAWRIMH